MQAKVTLPLATLIVALTTAPVVAQPQPALSATILAKSKATNEAPSASAEAERPESGAKAMTRRGMECGQAAMGDGQRQMARLQSVGRSREAYRAEPLELDRGFMTGHEGQFSRQ
jgi:hypothetical protein